MTRFAGLDYYRTMESNVQATSRRAVVLLSGGLDSVTALAIAKSQGFSCYALSFRYGQRHSVELAAAERNAAALGAIRHQICDIDLRWVGGSALTSEVSVPKDRSLSAMNDGEIPITYVPARNTLFLSYALGWAEVLGATAIVIGANVYDSSGYPDCRPAFLRAFEQLAELGTRAGAQGQKIAIFAPLIDMTKAEIIQAGLKLGVDYSLTHSCYDPIGDLACGRCDSCLLRSKGFREAGAADPTRYVAPTKTQ